MEKERKYRIDKKDREFADLLIRHPFIKELLDVWAPEVEPETRNFKHYRTIKLDE